MVFYNLFEIDSIIHLLVPLIIIRIISLFYKIDKKLIFILSVLSLIPDIDFFFSWHRAVLHNLFVGTELTVISTFLLKKYYNKLKIALLSSYFFLSHLVLDGFMVAWFYPVIRYHFNPFTGQKVTLQAMNLAKPLITTKVALIGIIGIIIVYGLMYYEIYRENARKNKK